MADGHVFFFLQTDLEKNVKANLKRIELSHSVRNQKIHSCCKAHWSKFTLALYVLEFFTKKYVLERQYYVLSFKNQVAFLFQNSTCVYKYVTNTISVWQEFLHYYKQHNTVRNRQAKTHIYAAIFDRKENKNREQKQVWGHLCFVSYLLHYLCMLIGKLIIYLLQYNYQKVKKTILIKIQDAHALTTLPDSLINDSLPNQKGGRACSKGI